MEDLPRSHKDTYLSCVVKKKWEIQIKTNAEFIFIFYLFYFF